MGVTPIQPSKAQARDAISTDPVMMGFMLILSKVCDIALGCPAGHTAEMSSHCGVDVLPCSGAADDVLPLANGVVVKVKGKLFTVNRGTAIGIVQLLVGEHGPGADMPIEAIGVFGKGFLRLNQGLLDLGLNGHVDVNGGFHGAPFGDVAITCWGASDWYVL